MKTRMNLISYSCTKKLRLKIKREENTTREWKNERNNQEPIFAKGVVECCVMQSVMLYIFFPKRQS